MAFFWRNDDKPLGLGVSYLVFAGKPMLVVGDKNQTKSWYSLERLYGPHIVKSSEWWFVDVGIPKIA